MSHNKHPGFLKVFVINLLCIAAATVTTAATQSVPVLNTGLFILVLMLMSNEVWYRVTALPSLILAVVGVFRKSTEKAQEKQGRLVLRLTSCVLLIVPHIIFGLLYLADTLTRGKAANSLDICISHGVFACAFAAPALLWLIAQVATVFPLSVEQLFVEDEFILGPEKPTGDTPDELPPVPKATAAGAPSHPQLRELAGELLYHARPEAGVTNAHARTHATIGYSLLPIVLIMAALALNNYEQSALFAGVSGSLAGIFGWVCYILINEPAAWRRKLSRVEYAFTATHAYIAEGNELQAFSIDTTLNIQYEPINHDTGNIYLTQAGKLGAAMRKLMGNQLQINDARSTNNLRAPLCGFLHIRHANEVWKQLLQLQDARSHRPGQTAAESACQ